MSAVPASALLAVPAAVGTYMYFVPPPEERPEDAESDVQSGGVLSIGLSAAYLGGSYYLMQAPTTTLHSARSCAKYALGWQAAGIAPLAGAAVYSFVKRTFGAGGDGAKEDETAAEAALTEGAALGVMFAPAMTGLGLVLRPDELHIVPALSTLYVTGRLLSRRGTRYSSAVGMGLSLAPIATALGLIAREAL